MSTPTPSRELNSWKEIAGFLGVSVRTAQKWEAERGLPVRRLPGARGPVSVELGELEAWRDSTRPETEQAAHAQVLGQRPLRLAVLVLVVLAGSLGAYLAMNRKGPPALFRVELNAFIVSDEHGRELWRKVFKEPLYIDAYSGQPARTALRQMVQFDDLDGDGHVEVLFVHLPVVFSPEGSALHCFSDKGIEKWRFVPGRTVSTPSEVFAPPYGVTAYGVVPMGKDRARAIVFSSCHAEYYPDQVVLLSAKGEVLREYWHSGCLGTMEVADLDGDGRPEIYLGGVSNAYKQATLVVLGPDSFGGASVETENPAYQLQGFAPGNEIARILFPRTCINRKFEPFNGASRFVMRPDSLTVFVNEFVGEQRNAPVLYLLGKDLSLEGAEFEFQFRALHAELASTGQLDHSLSAAEEAQLRNIRYLPAGLSKGTSAKRR